MNYVVGDIQGCYKGLRALLKKVEFCEQRDTLWAVGDLVARGEDSLSTLDFLYDLGPQFKTVLGNHDLHLLSVVNGIKKAKDKDNLHTLLKSPNIHKYSDWLRQFPLACKIDDNTLLVHAGLYPKWSFKDAVRYSKEVETQLQSSEYELFLETMYSSEPCTWKEAKNTEHRLVFITNTLTRMRYLEREGQLNFSEKHAPSQTDNHFIPWYKMRNCLIPPHQRILFGHWASLMGNTGLSHVIGLDTGFVWGGRLSCLCLESNKITTIEN